MMVPLLIGAKPGVAKDPYFANVSLLLHCDGTNGSTTLTDSSSYGHAVTCVGTADLSTSQAKFGTASALFNATGDQLSLPSHASLAMNSSDFTVEFWMYTASPGTLSGIFQTGLLASSSGGLSIAQSASTSGAITLFGNDGNPRLDGTIAVASNTWTHVAITRSGNTAYIFINGVLDVFHGSSFAGLNFTSTHVRLGVNETVSGNNFRPYTGYIDDFRVTRLVARYTASFTPPTRAYSNS